MSTNSLFERLPQLRDFQWRLDLRVSDAAGSAAPEPVYVLSFVVENDGEDREVFLEADHAALRNFSDILDQMLRDARSGHARKMMRDVA
ncbi:hypertension-related calcium-regulated gene protein [Kipferlia bialata]|uniref:Hypertension-related calcium-regulated gene protein n=1 Tax=Kipferlia bialata TaxID=797122 RepID=A0A391NRG3_9EUKA|nr:hypertension-related calcium-regulated gene protein [Kipferlia bialata]|eukprot:g5448.t1